MKKLLILLSASLILSTCASRKTVYMYNPQTGATAECKRDLWEDFFLEEKHVLWECVRFYMNLGYKRVDIDFQPVDRLQPHPHHKREAKEASKGEESVAPDQK